MTLLAYNNSPYLTATLSKTNPLTYIFAFFHRIYTFHVGWNAKGRAADVDTVLAPLQRWKRYVETAVLISELVKEEETSFFQATLNIQSKRLFW